MPINKIIKKTAELSGVENAAGVLEKALNEAHSHLDSYVEPVRKSVLKRYPTLFTLVVTVGVTTTFLGLEQILLSFTILRDKPWVLFFVGVTILVITGRTYKKLDQ